MPKINHEEYEVLKSYISEEKYIAKDRDGSIRLLTDYPERDMKREEWSDGWGKSTLKNSANNFKFIQWEDEEPYNIVELIEEYEDYAYTAEHFSNAMRKLAKALGDSWNESEETEVKNIEWLNTEVAKRINKIKTDEVSFVGSDFYDEGYIHGMNDVQAIANQLDEPEVLSQELPVIPQFVADWISEVKPDNSLRVAFEYIAQRKIDNYDDELAFWVEEGNSETFARAWLDGFTVEEEQKYYVMNNDNRMMLVRMMDGKTITEADPFPFGELYDGEKKSHRLTEQEIKDYDERYFAFAVRVEEVKEC